MLHRIKLLLVIILLTNTQSKAQQTDTLYLFPDSTKFETDLTWLGDIINAAVKFTHPFLSQYSLESVLYMNKYGAIPQGFVNVSTGSIPEQNIIHSQFFQLTSNYPNWSELKFNPRINIFSQSFYISVLPFLAVDVVSIVLDSLIMNQWAHNAVWGWREGLEGYFPCKAVINHEIVPVELRSFSANPIKGGIELSWITATELNNRCFEVERKSVESGWRLIGFQGGAGTTTEEQHYRFFDNSPYEGINIYRLKQIDFNGQWVFSQEVSSNYNYVSSFRLYQNYPNPFNSSTTIEFEIIERLFVTLNIFNCMGEEVALLINEEIDPGKHSVIFNSKQMASGVYFYKLQTNKNSEIKSMVILN